MRYAMARFNQHQRELAYRIYITDSLRVITGNTTRYADFLLHKDNDTRSGQEIVDDIVKRAGIEVIKK